MFGFLKINRAISDLKERRKLEAKSTQGDVAPGIHDLIEDNPLYSEIFRQVNAKVEESLSKEPKRRGLCHLEWQLKKKILFNEYGVVWFSPADLNPFKFD